MYFKNIFLNKDFIQKSIYTNMIFNVKKFLNNVKSKISINNN